MTDHTHLFGDSNKVMSVVGTQAQFQVEVTYLSRRNDWLECA